MIRYMQHAIWLALRPLIRPFGQVRRKAVEEREAELERYQREQDAALHELKIELLLAKRQGMREQARQQERRT